MNLVVHSPCETELYNNVFFYNLVQNQSEDKSKNDSIKIVSRGHLPPAPAKGASRAAKMRAVARGDDTASTLKHEQQVSCDFFCYDTFLGGLDNK